MKPEEVAAYLKEHPEFFETYADVLAEIYLPHPHGGRAVPISERQILTLREKNRQIEGKLREVIQFGEENDAISAKVHRFSLALLAASDIRGVLNAIYLNLREDFAVPHVALRVWHAGGHGDLPEFKPVSDAAREFATGLAHPHTSAQAMYIPLRGSEVFGLLALASEDPQRFYPEMGTLYLKRLGDLVGAAITRHLK
jgi:uncharacterized protein YigA (DUF484 family)